MQWMGPGSGHMSEGTGSDFDLAALNVLVPTCYFLSCCTEIPVPTSAVTWRCARASQLVWALCLAQSRRPGRARALKQLRDLQWWLAVLVPEGGCLTFVCHKGVF